MAPPLLPLTRLISCPACAEHVKTSEESCPHCGAALPGPAGRLARAAGAALLGVMLASCSEVQALYGVATTSEATTDTPNPTETTGATDPTTMAATEGNTTGEPTGGMSGTQGETGETTGTGTDESGGTTVDTEATGTGDSSGSESGSGTMTDGPEYGVPGTTTGPEPEYGVPGTTTTGDEPDYGVPGTT